jgi:hypothetical protein
VQLNPEQISAIQQGQPVHLLEPQSGTECVLLPASVYRRVKAVIEDSPFSHDERLALLADSGKRMGWDDPSMDAYDDYDRYHK